VARRKGRTPQAAEEEDSKRKSRSKRLLFRGKLGLGSHFPKGKDLNQSLIKRGTIGKERIISPGRGRKKRQEKGGFRRQRVGGGRLYLAR